MERTRLCGEGYAHQEHRQAVRARARPEFFGPGRAPGGDIQRPRARSGDGRELSRRTGKRGVHVIR